MLLFCKCFFNAASPRAASIDKPTMNVTVDFIFWRMLLIGLFVYSFYVIEWDKVEGLTLQGCNEIRIRHRRIFGPNCRYQQKVVFKD